jgi:hypothetical protein
MDFIDPIPAPDSIEPFRPAVVTEKSYPLDGSEAAGRVAEHDPRSIRYEGGPTADELRQDTALSQGDSGPFLAVRDLGGAAITGGTGGEDRSAPVYANPELSRWVGAKESPYFQRALEKQLGHANVTDAELDALSTEQVNEIVCALPQVLALPTAGELPALTAKHGLEPLGVEKRVTVSDVRAHLADSTVETPEISIRVFGSTDAVRVGTEDGIPRIKGWSLIQDKARLVFHTHPGPSQNPDDHLPGDGDLYAAEDSQAPQMIASASGLTVYDAVPGGFSPAWEAYATDRFTEAELSIMQQGDLERLYYGFVRDVVKPAAIPWDKIPHDMPLLDVVTYAHAQLRDDKRG